MNMINSLRSLGYDNSKHSIEEEEKFKVNDLQLMEDFKAMIPDYNERMALLPSPLEIEELKGIKNPGSAIRDVMTLFLLILDCS